MQFGNCRNLLESCAWEESCCDLGVNSVVSFEVRDVRYVLDSVLREVSKCVRVMDETLVQVAGRLGDAWVDADEQQRCFAGGADDGREPVELLVARSREGQSCALAVCAREHVSD